MRIEDEEINEISINEEEKKEQKTEKNETVEKQKKYYENKENKKKKRIKIGIIIGIIIILLLVFSIIFAVMNINSDKIISGISINEIEVSGLSKEEAREKIEKVIAENKTKEIALKYEEYETQINPELIEVNYDIDGV